MVDGLGGGLAGRGMNGPEHYREAERLMDSAVTWSVTDPARVDQIASAQVHATLALAAATADLIPAECTRSVQEWTEVTW